MSNLELNKGKLIPVGVDTEHFTEEDYETYRENGFLIIDYEVFGVEWEVRAGTDCLYLADVKENSDGTINFHTLHYDCGTDLEEVIEGGLNAK